MRMPSVRVSSLLFAALIVVAWLYGPVRTSAEEDWANLARYRAANAVLKPAEAGVSRIVFFGDSITDFWAGTSPGFFAGRPFVDRGIAGQTSPQMLVRFQQDVVALRPKAVVILAGINDMHKTADPALDTRIEDNIRSMVAIAKSAGIAPLLCSLLPVGDAKYRDRVARFNAWLKGYAKDNGILFVDYFAAMADRDGTMPARLSADGLHPNLEGYAIMQPIVLAALQNAGVLPR